MADINTSESNLDELLRESFVFYIAQRREGECDIMKESLRFLKEGRFIGGYYVCANIFDLVRGIGHFSKLIQDFSRAFIVANEPIKPSRYDRWLIGEGKLLDLMMQKYVNDLERREKFLQLMAEKGANAAVIRYKWGEKRKQGLDRVCVVDASSKIFDAEHVYKILLRIKRSEDVRLGYNEGGIVFL